MSRVCEVFGASFKDNTAPGLLTSAIIFTPGHFTIYSVIGRVVLKVPSKNALLIMFVSVKLLFQH